MIPPFVKKFDFRGIYNKDITDKDAFYLGLAIQKSLLLKKVLVGWDTRSSSKNLAMNFIQSLHPDIEISYLDTCPIDYVTAAANAFDFDFSVMFTGSHNAWDWTGLLMHTKGGASVEGDLVTSIVENYHTALQDAYQSPNIQLTKLKDFQASVEEVYKKKIESLIPLDKIKPLQVLVDIGDGSGSKGIDVLEKLLPQVTFHRLNDRKHYDETSPHTADPSNIENMQQLMDGIKKDHYDCGFAFDSDADRVLAVDEKANYQNGSLLGSAMIEVFSGLRNPMKIFGYAVECGPAIYNTVVDLQKAMDISQTATPVPVGRSILRRMIREGTIDMGIESVGHFYIKDFFLTDSGAFSLVAILYWISTYGPLSSLSQKHPDGKRIQFSLPIAANQEEKDTALIDAVIQRLNMKENKKIIVDGIRYEFFDGGYLTSWFAIRPSGYEPIEKYYFGSLHEGDYAFLKETIRKE